MLSLHEKKYICIYKYIHIYLFNCRMDINANLLYKLKIYGVGRRKLDDNIFKDKPPRLGIYDADEEQFYHAT